MTNNEIENEIKEYQKRLERLYSIILTGTGLGIILYIINSLFNII